MVRLNFIDAHCHLIEPYFKLPELKDIIKSAKTNNVTHIINCASFPETFDQCLQSSDHVEIDVTLGLQPTLAKTMVDASVLREVMQTHPLAGRIKAIGEVGLDHHWVKDQKEQERQQSLFLDCIDLANNSNLPLVIHSRKAETQVLNLLEKYSQVSVLLHSFEGNLKEVNRAKDLGYYITIPTNVVIRKNRRKVAIRTGLDHMMIETDSPYCAPSIDIKPNTPSTIPIAAKKISLLLEISVEELAKATSKNTRDFHKL